MSLPTGDKGYLIGNCFGPTCVNQGIDDQFFLLFEKIHMKQSSYELNKVIFHSSTQFSAMTSLRV